MNDWMPATADVRARYSTGPVGEQQFDRWLAEVERAAAEKAWDEGFRTCDAAWVETGDLSTPDEERTDPTNPYRKETR